MKRMVAILAALLALLAVSAALAENDGYVDVWTMYANRETVKVYKEQDKESKVIQKLKGGDSVIVETLSADGKWCAVLVEDTKRGGQQLGWVVYKYLSEDIPQEFCKHKWGKWRVEEEATCSEEGSQYRICKICRLRQEEKIEMLPHTFGKWKILEQATCAEKGERTRTCKVCGYREQEEYLEEHTFGAWTTKREPTCTRKGKREHTCEVCGTVEEQAIDKLPHDYAWTVTVETTDHSAGTRAKLCQVCGFNGGEESFDPEGTLRRKDRGDAVLEVQRLLVDQGYLNAGGADGIFGGGTEKALMQFQQDQGLAPDGVAWPQTIKRLNHEFGPWTTVKEMTRAEAGERVRTCVECGYQQREIIEPGIVLERGRRGEDIRTLQKVVKQLGYDAGSFDGIYGRKLDAALAGFAAANGLVVEEGRIRPADVDALMNAWFDLLPEQEWMGEGSVDTPVNMALTVTPTGGADDSGVVTYTWTLTNLGREKCAFNALLLTFGDEPDFRENNLVIAVDGYELKPNCANSASGSFSADEDWGEGNLNFAAFGTSDATGARWLSNVVSFENTRVRVAQTVEPRPTQVNVNALADGVYPVAFNRGDVLVGASGVFMNAVRVFSMDTYDVEAVNALASGDTLVVGGAPYAVDTVENWFGAVRINGGLSQPGGWELGLAGEGDFYRVFQDDDLPTYTELGVTTLTLAPTATFTDAWNIEAAPVTVDLADIAGAMAQSDNAYFDQYNTTVRIENGRVAEIVRDYTP